MNAESNNADVNRAIAEIRNEIGRKSDQVLSKDMTELLEKFAESSETLHVKLKKMTKKLTNFRPQSTQITLNLWILLPRNLKLINKKKKNLKKVSKVSPSFFLSSMILNL